jgi:hypothetical protein
MDDTTITNQPQRVTDLVHLKTSGHDIDLHMSFEIIPVNFAHDTHEFQAFIFLCRYSGSVNKTAFSFRKCYAKGCPHNLCPHVAQAVMIANRHLKRDYKKLLDAGLFIQETFFTLEDMVLKYEGLDPERDELTGGILTIYDYINIANEGNAVDIRIELELISAVEHFANQKNEQTYLNADFDITTLGKKSQFQRCLACFQTQNEAGEKSIAIQTANNRLKILYNEFNTAKIAYQPILFN